MGHYFHDTAAGGPLLIAGRCYAIAGGVCSMSPSVVPIVAGYVC
jgi:hypothetical protein